MKRLLTLILFFTLIYSGVNAQVQRMIGDSIVLGFKPNAKINLEGKIYLKRVDTGTGTDSILVISNGVVKKSIPVDGKANLSGGNAFSGFQDISGSVYINGNTDIESNLSVNGVISAHGGITALPNGTNATDAVNKSQLDTKENLSNKVTTLVGANNTTYPTSQAVAAALSSVVSGLQYQGGWNAFTNTPTLPAASSGNTGYFYVVTEAGTHSSIDYEVGDWTISDGTAWDKIPMSLIVADKANADGSNIEQADFRTALGLGTAAYVNADQNLTSANNPTFASLYLSTPTVNYRSTRFQTNALDRWAIAANDDAESSGNVGSNLEINRYTNTGSYLSTPLYIERATGNVFIENDLDIQGNASAANPTDSDHLTTKSYVDSLVVNSAGTYIPTASNFTNVYSAEMEGFKYTRVGNIVTVTGRIFEFVNISAGNSSYNISLPIASNLTSAYDLSGTAVVGGAHNNTLTYQPIIGIWGDSVNDKARFSIQIPGEDQLDIFLSFTYIIK